MARSFFGFPRPAPKSKTGHVISLSVTLEKPDLLRVGHNPDYYYVLIPLLLLTLCTGLFVFKGVHPLFVGVGVMLSIISGFAVAKKRELVSGFNKQKGTIEYFRNGLLGTRFGRIEGTYAISQISHLAIDVVTFNHAFGDPLIEEALWRMDGDKYGITLVLGNAKELPLSDRNLTRREACRYAKEIQKFLDNSIPIKKGNTYYNSGGRAPIAPESSSGP